MVISNECLCRQIVEKNTVLREFHLISQGNIYCNKKINLFTMGLNSFFVRTRKIQILLQSFEFSLKGQIINAQFEKHQNIFRYRYGNASIRCMLRV
jgi:hypothetical protein